MGCRKQCVHVALTVTFACQLWALRAADAGAAAPDAAGSNQYNVILISLTNTRADHLGAYGYTRNTSTNIDALARKSLVFKHVFAHASWTLPAAMSVFTSQYPFTHGLMNREEAEPLPSSAVTFVDVLKENGYTTAAFVGDRDYSPRFGHTSRFHYAFEPPAKSETDDWKSYGVLENVMPPAREWLRQNRDKKFFLLVQGYNTHCPFAVPKEDSRFDPNYRGKIDFTRCYWTFERTRPIKMRSAAGLYEDVYLLKTKPADGEDTEVMFYPDDVKHMVALYDGEIHHADHLVGGILQDLAALGLDRKTIVIIYSDHGDMFGKHGRFMRGGPLRGTFYDDVLRIPVIIYHPARKPATIEGLGQGIDLAPTLIELTGCKARSEFKGKSLLPMIDAGKAVNEFVFAGSLFKPSAQNRFFQNESVILAARSRDWKLIFERVMLSPGPHDTVELYDVRSDPDELRNVAQQQQATVEQMKHALRAWLRDIKAEQVVPNL
jgi:arylsulfatase A-like enzyme